MKVSKFVEKVAALRKSRSGKFVYSLIVLVLSATIFTFACVTFAWFVNSDNAQGSGMDITATTYNVNVSASGYMWDVDGIRGTNKQVIVRAGDELVRPDNPAVIDVAQGITMHQYDMIFTERNRYTPFVIKLDITSSTIAAGGDGSVSTRLFPLSTIRADSIRTFRTLRSLRRYTTRTRLT